MIKIDMADPGSQDLHQLLGSIIAPRPIAFVSSVGEDGIFNLAPFALFTRISLKPALVGISLSWRKDGSKKDTLLNIESVKDFVICVVNETLAEPMNKASDQYPHNIDEFAEAGLTPVKADLVKAPLVAESPINMECRMAQVLEFGEFPDKSSFIIGELLRVHVREDLFVDGKIQMSKLRVIGRLGGSGLYCRTTDLFEMKSPGIE
jgi:flavin reductase (DIM6/NTAB) family NADH-FMN oxidoreductase RutF